MRVALAALLFTQPDLLLLDEPTNHLDLEATIWLEDYLRRYPGTILLVSHDRELLNRSVGQILHLEHGKLTLYQGGYDRFEETRSMRLMLDDKLRAKQEAQRAHILKFVERFRYKASKSRQAQSRLKMLARMTPIAEHQEEGSIVFDFPDPGPLPSPLCSISRVDVGYDGKPVLSGLSLNLDSDDRIALLGANGNGKSTLMKLLAGRLAPLTGDIVRSRKLVIGYFAQHQAEELDLNATPLVELGRKRPNDTDRQLRSHLGRFGFSQQRAETKISAMSGGEKARLLLALITCDRPHVLLLDEPTNHLDISSRESLIHAINDFKGAVVLISHDPHMIELTADRFWLVAKGRVEPYDGDMEAYRLSLLARVEGAKDADRSNGRSDRKDQRRQAAERRQALGPLRKSLAEVEAKLGALGSQKSEIEARLADPAMYENATNAPVELRKKLAQVVRDLARAEETWLVLHTDLERVQADA
jgi:ATP-binding cassette subfamily F protein 3